LSSTKIRNDKKYPEKCEKCDYRPNNNRRYIQHKLIYHTSKEEKKAEFKYYCAKCNYGTYSEILFNNHTMTKKHIMAVD